MNLNNKLKKQVAQIRYYDTEQQQQAVLQWVHKHNTRVEFIEKLNKENIRGKEYSSAVAEYDRRVR